MKNGALLACVGCLAFPALMLGSCERVEGCEYTGTCPDTGAGADGQFTGGASGSGGQSAADGDGSSGEGGVRGGEGGVSGGEGGATEVGALTAAGATAGEGGASVADRACASRCGGRTPFCEEQTGNCVACLEAGDCTDPAAPRCENGTCGPCTTKSHCRHIEGAHVCSGGRCVECTVVDESDCGANACNPATERCTKTARGSVGPCGRCLADSECLGGDTEVPDARCVALEFQRIRLQGGYCLKRLSAESDCARPFSPMAEPLTSLSGAPPELYCGLDTEVTRCEAILDLVNARHCPDGMDSSCGCARDADGNCSGTGSGGLCGTVGGVLNRCSYACASVSDCPSGTTCSVDGARCE